MKRLAWFLLAAPIWGQCQSKYGGICNTSATAEIDTVSTTYVTQQVNTYSTELKGRIQSGAYLYDQTFPADYTDSAVQAAITSAKAVLAGHGAVIFTGPTLLSNHQSTSSSVNTVQNGVIGTVVSTASYSFSGPTTVSTGDHGICQSVTLPTQGAWFIAFVGCTKTGEDFPVGNYSTDFDGQTTTTTNTTLTTQVHELDGFPQIPGTPAPSSLILLLTGLGGIALWLSCRSATSA